MPSATASRTPAIARCLWRGTWAQLVLQSTVLVLLLTTRFGAARPAFIDYLATDEVSPRQAADTTRLEGLDLRSLCARTQSVEMRVLCKLTQPGDSWSEVEERKQLIHKRSDGSSLSAFQRLVSHLRAEAQQRSEARQKLQDLRAMGVLDENNQIISLPEDMRENMERLG
ncbi:uncharacterized protein LOC110975401 [Acanthaster planci]|uniref:Uncharacterized protein LOC110975401 n=1 Tax=Acanthaster planci TaxID=133434 RepID=A0A8B7XU67_ACAPL|nr:uncharacterized protein LOC110975401 [Acanthaster planci]